MRNMTETAPTPTPTAVVADAEIAALASKAEALLFSIDRPLPPVRLAEALGLVPREEAAAAPAGEGTASEEAAPVPVVKKGSTKAKFDAAAREAALARLAGAIEGLNAEYERTGRTFRIELLAGGYRVMTLPQFAQVIADFHRARLAAKLSRPAIETLAIIAYKQPITRAQLESIRGVSCGEVLRALIERKLVAIKGRAEELGRPLLYATHPKFLEHFGLASIRDLPTLAELKPA
ncbi:MAG: SMC-Scp complex subunit ScpB [Tepidisphaera sp.]|nr:SMC-Scp complex subunit ScpB [Tepidisphaera sp.]